ncbi:MAG: hypothetical protein GX222_05900 [Ruminococcaceae bacterium]|nr:hypothetical protein [Oscillospiraceae bacterium]
MKYVVSGTFIINKIEFPDGSTIEDIIGGGSFYAYTGIRFAEKDSLIVSAIGEDFEEYYGKWFRDNNISKSGLIKRLNRCTYNGLKYHPDGRYDAHSVYNDEVGKLFPEKGHILPLEMVPFITRDTEGMYMGAEMTEEIFLQLIELKKMFPKLKIMWEYYPEKKDTNVKYIGFSRFNEVVDIFSINRPESFNLFGTKSDEESIERLYESGMPTYYRVGKEGAYMLSNGKSYFSESISVVPETEEIDPTGCGNSSTGAVLWAWVEGYDPLFCCIWGNMVAAHTVQQYGPYPDLNKETYENAMKKAKEIYDELKLN